MPTTLRFITSAQDQQSFIDSLSRIIIHTDENDTVDTEPDGMIQALSQSRDATTVVDV